MPCTKKMIQKSESASKQAFIHGHFFGTVGVLIGNLTKIFCLPLSIQIHDSDKAICGWEGDESVSHVVQMAKQDSLTITKIIFSRQISVKQGNFDRLVN